MRIVPPPQPCDKELYHIFQTNFHLTPVLPERVFWFHMTRCLPNTVFKEGLLPLTLSLPHIWNTLFTVFKDTEHEHRLLELKSNGILDGLYTMKTKDPFHAGPYAMLIRDVAYHSHELGYHDYLRLPEIIEDICNTYEKHYGMRLHDQLDQTLKPTIVKFWSDKHCDIRCVEAALYYLHVTGRGEPLSMHANTCFDSKNEVILPEQIVKIEIAN